MWHFPAMFFMNITGRETCRERHYVGKPPGGHLNNCWQGQDCSGCLRVTGRRRVPSICMGSLLPWVRLPIQCTAENCEGAGLKMSDLLLTYPWLPFGPMITSARSVLSVPMYNGFIALLFFDTSVIGIFIFFRYWNFTV